MTKVTTYQDEKLGDIIIIEDIDNNCFLIYRKCDPKLKIKERTKEEAVKELRRINRRLRESE